MAAIVKARRPPYRPLLAPGSTKPPHTQKEASFDHVTRTRDAGGIFDLQLGSQDFYRI